MLLACQLTGPLMRQCLSKAPIGASLARRPRRLMSTEPSYGKPGWMNLPEGQRRNEWGHIMDIATTSSTTSKEQGSPESIWEAWERRHVSTLPRPHTAYSGRSVSVVQGDLQSALVRLKGILTINAVRASHVRDERHEKKGEKRNRLKSQRWRRRFAHEVRKKVQLVNEIRARGA